MNINPHIQKVTAFAPATCANVAVGFDILGFALENIGDQVTITRRDDHRFMIESNEFDSLLPKDPEKNTASFVCQKLCEDLQLKIGLNFKIKKGIPLSSGMGGSAASAVAALTALNAFLTSPLSKEELIHYTLYGEALASGQSHADNVIPSLVGGLVLIHNINPLRFISLPVPDLFCVIVNPKIAIETKMARNILAEKVNLEVYVKQTAKLAGFIAALYRVDLTLLQESLRDEIIEQQRAHLVPGFYKLKQCAIDSGALGFSFSGSGPALFAFVHGEKQANTIKLALEQQLNDLFLDATVWLSRINPRGSEILNIGKR